MGRVLAFVLAAGFGGGVAAQDAAVVRDYPGSFDDATFSVESAIVGRGLVVDHVSHVGEMLARTAEDVGSDVTLFEGADVFLFCSAVVSREVMEADPANIVHCPYSIYVTDRGGEVTVGYPAYPGETMAPVRDLLDGIVAEALGE